MKSESYVCLPREASAAVEDVIEIRATEFVAYEPAP
jgi:hypothetical protein